MADRRGSGGVPDAHLARDQQIGTGIDRFPAGVQRGQAVGLAHCRALREIIGRPVEFERMNIHARPGQRGKLIDRGAAGAKIRNHLLRHFRRKGGDAPGADAVIAREHEDLRRADVRPGRAAPARIPDRQILEPPERARRLGQLAIAVGRVCARRKIGARRIGEARAKFVQSGKPLQHGA